MRENIIKYGLGFGLLLFLLSSFTRKKGGVSTSKGDFTSNGFIPNVTQFGTADYSYLTPTPVNRAIRNNNPLNIEYKPDNANILPALVPYSNNTDTDANGVIVKQYEQFEDFESGIFAAKRIFRIGFNLQDKETIQDLLVWWKGAKATPAYISFVSQFTGIDKNTSLLPLIVQSGEGEILSKLLDAMSRYESGRTRAEDLPIITPSQMSNGLYNTYLDPTDTESYMKY